MTDGSRWPGLSLTVRSNPKYFSHPCLNNGSTVVTEVRVQISTQKKFNSCLPKKQEELLHL